MAVIKVMAKIPFPIKIVHIWIVNQLFLKIGFTATSSSGIVDEMIIRHAERGAMNEPNTISLNFK